MGTSVKSQRQLHDVIEIAGQHRLTLAMGEAVGMKRDAGIAGNREQPERDPCA